MGYIMETDLDMKDHDICTLCPKNCEHCRKDQGLNDICNQFPHMSLGGCLSYLNVCRIYHGDSLMSEYDDATCVYRSQQES